MGTKIQGALIISLLLCIWQQVPAVSQTPTPTPHVIYPRPVAHLTADPIRPRIYGTLPEENALIVIDTTSLAVTQTIWVGSYPHGLSISADRSKLWVAISGSTNFAITPIDLDTLQRLPSLPAPDQPYDVEEGAGHRLFLTPLSQPFLKGGIMQINADTGMFQKYLGGSEISYNGLLEISPDRNTLFFGSQGGSTMDKFDVTTADSSLLQLQMFYSGGVGLRINHSGEFIVYPNAVGNASPPAYTTFKIPTADITTKDGSFEVGTDPRAAVFSNDDSILYQTAAAFSQDCVVRIFDTTSLAALGTIPLGGTVNLSVNDVVVDRSGHWLFVAIKDFLSAGQLQVVDTGRSDPLPTPTPGGSPTPTVAPPPATPTPDPTPVPVGPRTILTQGVGQMVPDLVRSRVYATVPGVNSIAVVDTTSNNIIETINIGSSPQGLSVSADGSKLWVAASGLTVASINLDTLQQLPGLTVPNDPYDVEEGTGHRLYMPSGSGIMQIDSETGAFQGYLPGSQTAFSGAVEVTPDRNTLIFATNHGSCAEVLKFDVSTKNAALVQQTSVCGGNGQRIKMSHNGHVIAYPFPGNPPGYIVAALSTANIAGINGVFITGAYPGPAVFSNDDSILYCGASGDDRVVIFDAITYLPLRTIPFITDAETSDITTDRTGRWLFVSTLDFDNSGDLRVFDTGRIDIYAPPPTPTPTQTPTATPTPTNTPTPTPPAAHAVNISTRMRVETGDNALIGGFIVTGTATKEVVIRGIGPSLTQFGVPDALTDPALELHTGNGALLRQNDNWQDDQSQAKLLNSLGLAPQNSVESGIVDFLSTGPYTAVLAGQDNGTGVGLLEIYDVNPQANAELANISTRGFVLTDSNVMIGGFILQGSNNSNIVVRGIGPSLAQFGVSPALTDPTIELHDSNGTLLIANDNWQDESGSAAQLTALGLAPQDTAESGIYASLPPASFTAILAGKDGGTGIGLVEIYNVH